MKCQQTYPTNKAARSLTTPSRTRFYEIWFYYFFIKLNLALFVAGLRPCLVSLWRPQGTTVKRPSKQLGCFEPAAQDVSQTRDMNVITNTGFVVPAVNLAKKKPRKNGAFLLPN